MCANAFSEKSDVALLIASCDAYSEIAVLCASQIAIRGGKKYFPCYISVGANSDCRSDGFKTICTGPKATWSEDLSAALGAIDQSYVFLWIDDLILAADCDWYHLRSLCDWLMSIEGNYLRFNPTPRGSGYLIAPGIKEVLPGSAYRASTVMSVWRKDFLLNILNKSESAWQFEIHGSRRTDPYQGFFASESESLSFRNLVVKGLIDPRAEAKLNKSGIMTNSISRRRMSLFELLQLQAKEMISRAARRLPTRVQNAVRRRMYQ